jgi:hypothetical protein
VLAFAIPYVGVMLYVGIKKEQARDYPEWTPTELPRMPSWMPEPQERGQG